MFSVFFFFLHTTFFYQPLVDPGEDGIEGRLLESADEPSRAPHECGALPGHEDARHAPASSRWIPPDHEQRSTIPPGWFFLLFNDLKILLSLSGGKFAIRSSSSL